MTARAQAGEAVAVLIVGGIGVLGVAATVRLARGAGDANVVVGSRARVSTPLEAIHGRVLALSPDSLVIEENGMQRGLALSEITDVRVDVGPESKWAQGWAIGLGVGAATGIAVGLASGDDHSGDIELTAGAKATIAGVALGLAGSVVATLVVATIEGPALARGRLPGQSVSLELTPVLREHVGLAARLRF